MEKRKFQKLIKRNILFLGIPRAIMLFAIFLIAFEMVELERFSANEVENINEAITLYEVGENNFNLDISNLLYTGFDYKEGDKVKGSYYYVIDNNKMVLFLLDNKCVEKVKNNPIAKNNLNCKIIVDDSVASYVSGEYSTALGINYDDMDGYCSNYVFSQMQYPYVSIFVINMIEYVSAFLLVLLVIMSVFYCMKPWDYPGVKKLGEYGDIKTVMNELDDEMENHMLYSQDNVYVTEKYLLVGYISRVDVILLDDIMYLSKHIEKKKTLFSNKTKIYRLTASNPDKLYYECDFFDEDVINDVIYYIRGDEDEDIEDIEEVDEIKDEENSEDKE